MKEKSVSVDICKATLSIIRSAAKLSGYLVHVLKEQLCVSKVIILIDFSRAEMSIAILDHLELLQVNLQLCQFWRYCMRYMNFVTSYMDWQGSTKQQRYACWSRSFEVPRVPKRAHNFNFTIKRGKWSLRTSILCSITPSCLCLLYTTPCKPYISTSSQSLGVLHLLWRQFGWNCRVHHTLKLLSPMILDDCPRLMLKLKLLKVSRSAHLRYFSIHVDPRRSKPLAVRKTGSARQSRPESMHQQRNGRWF